MFEEDGLEETRARCHIGFHAEHCLLHFLFQHRVSKLVPAKVIQTMDEGHIQIVLVSGG